MHSLTQLLRNLSHKDFEALCFHLLKERYPNANIMRMEGSGGDKGIDLFAGRLLDRSCTWQCKHFPNGVKRPQRRQIEKSFETALRNYRPKRWILCLSVDLDPNGRDWFEKLQRKHEPEVEIDLIQGSDIDHALMYHQVIREKFFPEAQVNVRELKALLAGTEKFSNEELEKVTLANAQEYLARLQEKDPRFAYDLTFSAGGPVPLVGDPTGPRVREGLVASIFDGEKRLDVLARDVEALRMDPVTGSFQLRGEKAAEKFLRYLRRGTTEAFDAEELGKVELPFAFLLPGEFQPAKLIIGPPADLSEKQYFWKVTFSLGESSVVYGLIEFAKTRQGTDEIELRSSENSLPFRITVTVLKNKGGTVHIKSCWEGRGVQAVKKGFHALRIIQRGGSVDVFDTKQERHLFTASVQPSEITSNQKKFDQFVSDLAEISDAFGVPIKMTKNISRQDLKAFEELLQVARTGRNIQEASEISMGLRKEKEKEDAILAWQNTEHALYIGSPMPVTLDLLGSHFELGPSTMYCGRAVMCDSEESYQKYVAACEGGAVSLKFKPLAPVEQIFHKFQPEPGTDQSRGQADAPVT